MGCGDSRTPSAQVRDPLEANVVVLTEGDNRVALISLDALYVGPEFRNSLETSLRAELPTAGIFVGASHTHYAPMLDPTKPTMGEVDSVHLHRVTEIVVALALKLLNSSGTPVTVEVSRYGSDRTVNRRLKRLVGGAERRVRLNTVVMAPNLRRTRPQSGHIVRFKSAVGTEAYLWQLPCHPTSLPAGEAHSAHYPGAVRRHLRETDDRSVPVLFFQGFSGDLRPPAVANPQDFKSRVRRLTLGPWFEPFTEAGYAKWVAEVWSEARTALSVAVPRNPPAGGGLLETRRETVPLADLASEDGASDRRVSAHRVSIGSIDLVGISAEPVAAYASLLEGLDAGRVRIPVGCIDDVFGYAPTGEMIRQGGLEGVEFYKHFGLTSLDSDFENRFTNLLLSVLADASLDSS